MERQDAIKALNRAGRAKDVAKMIDEAVDQATRAFKEVRSDATRTDEYKRWHLAVASSRANRALNEKLERAAKDVVSTDRDDAEKVFGVRGLSGDAASLVISRRDAGDRVAEITNPQELRDLLTRATRTGDEVLARAIAERAMEIADTATLHQFVADRPQLDTPLERLWKAERASQDTWGATVRLGGLKPDELHGMSFDSIDALAQYGEPGSVSAASTGWGGY